MTSISSTFNRPFDLGQHVLNMAGIASQTLPDLHRLVSTCAHMHPRVDCAEAGSDDQRQAVENHIGTPLSEPLRILSENMDEHVLCAAAATLLIPYAVDKARETLQDRVAANAPLSLGFELSNMVRAAIDLPPVLLEKAYNSLPENGRTVFLLRATQDAQAHLADMRGTSLVRTFKNEGRRLQAARLRLLTIRDIAQGADTVVAARFFGVMTGLESPPAQNTASGPTGTTNIIALHTAAKPPTA